MPGTVLCACKELSRDSSVGAKSFGGVRSEYAAGNVLDGASIRPTVSLGGAPREML